MGVSSSSRGSAVGEPRGRRRSRGPGSISHRDSAVVIRAWLVVARSRASRMSPSASSYRWRLCALAWLTMWVGVDVMRPSPMSMVLTTGMPEATQSAAFRTDPPGPACTVQTSAAWTPTSSPTALSRRGGVVAPDAAAAGRSGAHSPGHRTRCCPRARPDNAIRRRSRRGSPRREPSSEVPLPYQ